MKPPTVFVDLDGLVLRHRGKGASAQWYGNAELLPGVREAFDEWEARGWGIVIITARKECVRYATEQSLKVEGLYWDQLIMGVTSGPRVMLNDEKPGQGTSALAFTSGRNVGLKEIAHAMRNRLGSR